MQSSPGSEQQSHRKKSITADLKALPLDDMLGIDSRKQLFPPLYDSISSLRFKKKNHTQNGRNHMVLWRVSEEKGEVLLEMLEKWTSHW